MSAIDRILSHESSKWIMGKIEELPRRSRFRAFNSIRSLNWSNVILHKSGLPIPACYCALHATEEAVAAFVSTAKESGYGDDAKINIKDHQAKATVSLLAQKLSTILMEHKPAVGYDPKSDSLIARFENSDGTTYHPASTRLAYFKNGEGEAAEDFFSELFKMFEGDVRTLRDAVLHIQEARNRIFYADSEGYPTGFETPEVLLERECQLCLGLIWASLDIYRHKGEPAPLIMQALRTANLVIQELKKKKSF